jgi:hypothetical protein
VVQSVIMHIDVQVNTIVLNGVKIFTKNIVLVLLLWTFLKVETN